MQVFRALQDALFRWFYLPYTQAMPGFSQVELKIKEAQKHHASLGLNDLLPAVTKVYGASYRLDRKVAVLRCIEAIRLHTAAHNGKLPSKLSDIAEVPVPFDPIYDRHFEYRVNGNKATLIAPPPKGQEAQSHNSLSYELTVIR